MKKDSKVKIESWFLSCEFKKKKDMIPWGLKKPKKGDVYGLELCKIDDNKLYFNFKKI